MIATKHSTLPKAAAFTGGSLNASAAARVEERIRSFAATHTQLFLRLSLAFVFCGFGVLKLFPGGSPAEHLAGETLRFLSLGKLSPLVGVPLLGLFELSIGFAVLFKPGARFTIPALLLHMAGTLTPLFVFPHAVFTQFPLPTLVGQYILKNFVLIAAALAILGAPRRDGV